MAEDKQHYRDNINLKRPGVQYEFSKEQIDEYLKCAEDPIYFIKNYMKIISLDEGIVLFNMYPFQEEMVNTFHENRFSIVRVGRQSGKCTKENSYISIRCKKTGEIQKINIGEFYNNIKNNS